MAWENITSAEVVVGQGEVFFFEHVGFGWEAGAEGQSVHFRITAGRHGDVALDDFAGMDYLLGALNPADMYPIRRVISGPAVVKCQAYQTGLEAKTVWARMDGWITPKEVPVK